MDPGATTVSIFGQEYTVRGGDDPDYVRRIASYLDERMNQLSQSTSQVSSMRVAILAALNITDELFQEREGLDDRHRHLRLRAERMAKSLQESCG